MWRQGTPVDGLHVVVSGEAQVCRRLPGERELELARIGPGDVLGEIPLLDGGTHSASVRALTPASLLFLDRAEFDARMLSRQPGALELRRRIVAIACDRLRRAHGALIEPGAEPPLGRWQTRPAAWARQPGTEVAQPPLGYVARLPLFRDMPAALVATLLEVGATRHMPRGEVVVRAGATPATFYLTLNGAVEDVLAAGAAEIRVGFAGPGRAFGYLGLLDGGMATATSVARERSTILAIGAAEFRTLLQAGDGRPGTFATAVERDLMIGLRQAERPICWLCGAT